MASRKVITPIYDKKLRRYEKKIINFIVESGESKRRTNMESHVLAYFLLREGMWLTQQDIHNLSQIFYESNSKKGFSKGTISKIVNQYEEYRVLKRRVQTNKKNAYEYSMSGELGELISTAMQFGIDEIEKYNSFLISKLKSLKARSAGNEEEFNLMERIKELIDYFNFHIILFKGEIDTKINQNYEIIQKNSKEKDQGDSLGNINTIETEIIKFVLDCPLFIIEEKNYALMMAYFFTRKRLTQDDLKKLTGLSAGMISEGLNYFLQKGYIELQKITGIRKRFYRLPSIAYYSYLRYSRRFNSISNRYKQLKDIQDELEAKKDELEDLIGFNAIQTRLKEFLEAKPLVDKLAILFKAAVDKFKPK